MSKCFFMSVPSTWLMHIDRISTWSSSSRCELNCKCHRCHNTATTHSLHMTLHPSPSTNAVKSQSMFKAHERHLLTCCTWHAKFRLLIQNGQMTADGHRLCDCATHGLCVTTSSDVSAAQTICATAALDAAHVCTSHIRAGCPCLQALLRDDLQQANHSRQSTAGKPSNSKVTGSTCLSTNIRLEPLFLCVRQMAHNTA